MARDFDKAAEQANDTFTALLEMFPQHREKIMAEQAKMYGEVVNILQPMVDLADGKITKDEYDAIAAARKAVDLERRLAVHGEPEDGGWEVECATCGTSHVWMLDEQGGPPPVFFECEELTGDPCDRDEDDEETD